MHGNDTRALFDILQEGFFVKMILDAIVHPTSVSLNDPIYDPEIHIPVEVLASKRFHEKMIGLPVTAYHHDTMKAVHILNRRKKHLTADNMREVLIELNKSLPGPLQLARQLLKSKNVPATASNIWKVLPEVISHARGPGVFGSVTNFWRKGNAWMVSIDVDAKKISSFQMKLIKRGGALGEVSLTHAVIDGTIEPLELSFTIKGLRQGSTISRIVSASYNTVQPNCHITHTMPETNTDIAEDVAAEVEVTSVPSADPTNVDSAKQLYGNLPEDLKSSYLSVLKEMKVTCASAAKAEYEQQTMNEANSKTSALEAKVTELESAFQVISESTASALNECSHLFGSIKPTWTNPSGMAQANQLVLAAAASNMKRKREAENDFDEVMKDFSKPANVIAASKQAKTKAAPEDEFFKELRNMRTALRNLD